MPTRAIGNQLTACCRGNFIYSSFEENLLKQYLSDTFISAAQLSVRESLFLVPNILDPITLIPNPKKGTLCALELCCVRKFLLAVMISVVAAVNENEQLHLQLQRVGR